MQARPATVFLALCGLAVLVVGGYVTYVKQRAPVSADQAAPLIEAEAPDPAPVPAPAASPPTPAPADAATTPAARPSPPSPRIYFRHTGVDTHYGMVAWVDGAKPAPAHFVESLRCEVVYVAADRGICLTADRGVFTTYAAKLFDARDYRITGDFALKGIPSRARVSIDGRLAAFTVFVSGHGYTTLDFSTQTLLVDVQTGAVLADLEDFEVRRDGAVIKAADFNFWGVTFTPDAREFYATLSTDGRHFLVRGDVAARRAEVIHENVECPSLSPDARRVAYKKRLRVDDRIVWQLQVLELASGRETALSERRSIDDQLEWLDNRHVLYSVPGVEGDASPSTDVWMASIDPGRPPRLFLRNAYSPAAVRCKAATACAAAGS